MGLKMPKLASSDLEPEWYQFKTQSNAHLFEDDAEENHAGDNVTEDDADDAETGLKMPRLYSQDLDPEWWQLKSPSNARLFEDDDERRAAGGNVPEDDAAAAEPPKKLDVLADAARNFVSAVKYVFSGKGGKGR
ncbi:hypothetical protein [Succinimonas sp.]|uniref:hypothetical protein n=1 Tax=Succinimonas sp. TaxID=1936151 RepID=UPI00387006A5